MGPHALTEQQKWCRYETFHIHLERYQNEGENLLNNIITIDETWVRRAYDVQGVIFCHFVPHGETVNAQYYAPYLQNHLRRAIRQLQNVIIFHDNDTPHKMICVRDLL